MINPYNPQFLRSFFPGKVGSLMWSVHTPCQHHSELPINFLLQNATKITGFFKVQKHDSKELILLLLDQLAFQVF